LRLIFGRAQHLCDDEAKVGPKHVDDHRAADIANFNELFEHELVHGVEDALAHNHDNQLGRVDLADERSKGDEERRHGEVGLKDHHHVHLE